MKNNYTIIITGGSGFIGTNLIELFVENKIHNIINIDKQKPFNIKQNKYWTKCNILNKPELLKIFIQFEPTHVIHLAAKTDTASNKIEDYIDNTEGTANLINIIEQTKSVRHAIITSTQYVYKSKDKPLPQKDDEFLPHTTYGISKKITEELVRSSNMKCAWTIIRPTNVWGPWHMRYPNELWRIIDKRLYFHPQNADPIKSYAYVKNVAHQINKIIELPSEIVNNKVFYLGDSPINSIIWLNNFSKELTGKKVKIIPKFLFYIISLIGEFLRKCNISFPLNLLRYENMISEYPTPMKKTIEILGLSHPDLNKNVKETIYWLKNEGNHFFNYWKKNKN